MADQEAYRPSDLDSLVSPESEAARVQDFADAVRQALHANKSETQTAKPDVLGELEVALSTLEAWIESDETSSEIVELFSKLQTKNLRRSPKAPEQGED